MFDLFDKMRADLQTWIWITCPFCSSESQPSRKTAGAGGYQEYIILECPDCHNSQKFITEWTPVIGFPLVNDVPEMIQGDVCPYLSINKNEDSILLRCCSRSPKDCFGRPMETCHSYHKTKGEEAFESGNYSISFNHSESSIRIWQHELPFYNPPPGTHLLVHSKRLSLSGSEWLSWIDTYLESLTTARNYGLAASIAFLVAEVSEYSRYWELAAHYYYSYQEMLKLDLQSLDYFDKKRREKEICRAEIMRLEAQSEVDEEHYSQIMIEAGRKWLEYYKMSGSPFSHPDFLNYAYYLRNLALAHPSDAPMYYEEAHDFLISHLDQVEYPRKRMYYEGHAKHFLTLSYLTKTNFINDIDKKIELLNEAIILLTESIELHKSIGLKGNVSNIQNMFIHVILNVEKFKRDENYEYIKEAVSFLDEARKFDLPHKYIECMDAITGVFEELFLALEDPPTSILLIARARQKLNDLTLLVQNFSPRYAIIPKILVENINYLAVYLDSIQKNITSFAGRRLSFNNIKTSLDEFRNHTERQLFRAFKITINPNEEIGRRLLQTHLQAAFSRRVFQFSEVQVASGKSDNLLIMNETKYPFEAKLWKGQKYYEKGLGQIKYYMNYENVKYGFYVIFDTRKRDYRSGGNIIEYNSKKIYELFIHINLRAP